jgi:hypothetical protein
LLPGDSSTSILASLPLIINLVIHLKCL